MDALELLKQIKLFARLPPPYIADLAKVAAREEHKPGERLVNQGDLGNRFFIVESGLVNLRQTDRLGIERSIGVIPTPPSQEPNEPPRRYFGEQMFTTQEPYEFHASVVRPTVVYVFTRQAFDQLVNQRPNLPHMLGFMRTAEKERTRGYGWVTEGEIIAMVEHKHWWALLPGLKPVAILSIAAAIILLVLHFILVPEMLAWAVIGLGLIDLLLFLYQFYDWLNDDYLVTNQRIAHVERVVFTRELRESVPIEKVLGVTVVRKFPAAVFGCTTVIVQTAGREQGDVTFEFVKHGEEIRELIQGGQERVKARQLAEERDQFRQSIRQELRHFLTPDAVAREREPQAPPPGGPPPRPPTHWRETIRRLVASWLNLELKESGRTVWRKHWIVLVRQTIRWFSGLLVVLVLAVIFALNSRIQFPGYWLGGLVMLVIFLAGLIYQWEDWRNDVYAVTDNQVIDTEALPFGLSSKSTTAPLDQVQDVRVEIPGALAFVLNYGNVKIETAGQSGQMIFYSIHDPRSAQEEIFRRLEAFRARRSERQSTIQSRSVIDALVAYDSLKRDQAQPSAAPDSPPTTPGTGSAST